MHKTTHTSEQNFFHLLKNVFTQEELKRLLAVQTWSAVTGIVYGLSLFSILAVGSSFATQQPILGLGFFIWLGIMFATALIALVLLYVGDSKKYRVVLDLLGDVYLNIGDRIAKLPIGSFGPNTAGAYSRMVAQELMNLGQFLSEGGSTAMQHAIALGTLTLAMFFWFPLVGCFLLLGILVCILLMYVGKKLQLITTNKIEEQESICAQRIIEYAHCQGALRAAHVAEHYQPLEESLGRVHNLRKRQIAWETLGILVQGIASINIPLMMAGFSLSLVSNGSLDIVSGLLLICLGLRAGHIIEGVINAHIMLVAGTGTLRLLSETLNQKTLVEPDESAPFTTPGSIAFSEVSFGYTPQKPVLQDINFTVEPGKMCAIVGPSGCGKTTIARLIARFYDVDAGQISVGGVPIEKLTTQDLMQQLSIVFQDVYLFNDTLHANILMAKPEATDEELAWAADLSGVSEIIARLPKGWQSVAGEGGHSLSGGERQRISIARALLKQAPIVLFDEATSALDAENEAHIVKAMETLRSKSTLLVIAHKLETIQAADQIIVLSKDGRIIERGTHAELVELDGAYHKFWKRRCDAEGWSLI